LPAPAAAAPAPVAWCGTDAAASDRKPDAVASRQIGVIYAFPSDAADRFGALATPIVTDLSVVDAWWRREDATRALRFDLAGFPSCATAIGRLDLMRVPLRRPSSFYAPFPGRFSAIANDLFGTFAFSNPHKKYLVYYDGAVEELDVCGTAAGQPNAGPSFAIVYIRACRADPVGEGALWADVAVHELVHALGVVPPGAPNACPGNPGHVCDSNTDLMFPSTSGQPLEEMLLDVGRNDYYGHSGGWFDLQDSAWLSHLDAPQLQLTVSTAGSTGTGQVVSDLPGIECPPACSIPWDSGTAVTLTASPGERTRFAGWAGPCTGAGPCSLRMDAARFVTALFALQVRLRVTVVSRDGFGSVASTPPGLSCSDTCTADFDRGQVVRLAAAPDPGSRFLGWGGPCSGRGDCVLTADAEPAVTASFGRAAYRLRVRVSGGGRVTSRPAGISCGRRCSALFRAEASVRLRPTAAAGWRFAGWSGACRGRGACVVRATADRSVRATFRRR
jgi:hypothetical protein